jgi:cobalt-zinc-cadmium efflux system outer membrane protein
MPAPYLQGFRRRGHLMRRAQWRNTAQMTSPLCSRPRALTFWPRSQRGATLGVLMLAAATSASAQRAIVEAPLTLRMLLDSVRVSHPLIEASSARVQAARGARTTASTLGNPVLSYAVDNTPFPGGRPIEGLDREAMTTVTLPLEPFYQRGARVTRANADIRAAEADGMATRQRVALDATRAYYRVALGQIMVATSRDLSAWLDTVVAYNRFRVKEGVTSEADLIRSGLERDRAAADATMAEAELAQGRAELSAFLGQPQVGRQVEVVAVPDVPLVMPRFAVLGDEPPAVGGTRAMPSPRTTILAPTALAARPDVRAARERLAAASASIVAEQRMVIRQIGATIGTKQMAGSTSMIAGLSLPIPLFDANRGEVQRASAERDVAAFELANQERVASANVIGAYESARLLTERATILTRGGPDSFLARAEEARRIALGAYREGAVPLFQVIDAARTWGDARLTYYRTLYAQHQSVLAFLATQGADLFAPASITTLSEPVR